MRNKGVWIKCSFFSQNIRAMISFMVNMVQVSFLKMTKDGTAIRNETIIRVWWVNAMRGNNIDNDLGISLDQLFFNV